jgi:hypothetical protein
VLIVVVGAAYFLFTHTKNAAISALPEGARVQLFGASSAGWYSFSAGKLAPVPGPAGFSGSSLVVLASATANAGADTTVLAHVPNTSGDIVATLHSGGAYTPLVVDGRPKQGLVTRADGFLAFAETGTSSAGTPALEVLAPGAKGPKSLGAGRPLAVLGSGTFLVATPTGIGTLDPATFATSSVVANGTMIAAVSSAGDRLATVNRTNSGIDLYALDAAGHAKYQYSIPAVVVLPPSTPPVAVATSSATAAARVRAGTSTPAVASTTRESSFPALPSVTRAIALGFANSGTLVVQFGSSSVALYNLATATSTAPTPSFTIPITSP